ncbi:MAG: ParB/RepB/Spo0J family partition protein [Chloroflexi bacterium]|nr:ParB/RepB/Spo0J family partition protein [Chloroflexota bacterium]
MSPVKRGLGRGLDALIPSLEPPAGVAEVPINSIRRNPRQPRQRFDAALLKELADSIQQHGILQPLIVAQNTDPGEYTLIAGERRLEAAKLAGFAAVPVVVREATEQQLLEITLIENIQREDLGPLESAHAYKHLSDDFGLSHEEIAARVGKNRVSVTNTLRLLRLPAKAQEALTAGLIAEGHARALLALSSVQAMSAALATVIGRSLNVRQTEELVRQMSGHKKEQPARRSKPAEVRSLENRLRDTFGTKVNVNKGRKGGTIVLHFYSDEELNDLAEKLLGEE